MSQRVSPPISRDAIYLELGTAAQRIADTLNGLLRRRTRSIEELQPHFSTFAANNPYIRRLSCLADALDK